MDGITKVRPGNGWKPHRNLHIYGKVEVNGVDHHPLYEYLKVSFLLIVFLTTNHETHRLKH